MFIGLVMNLMKQVKAFVLIPSTSSTLMETATDDLLLENGDRLMLEA